jgi:TolB protein
MAVLGHSGATGENSDPRRPRVEVRANSWATGTNPAVNSVYLRILAKNPEVRGHNFNLAQGGATVQRLALQADHAVSLQPQPGLFVVQIMDNDMVCPASARDYAAFRSAFVSALSVLAKGAPESRIFVVSQFGSPGTSARSLTRAERRTFGGTSPCDFVDPNGRIVPRKVARLEKVIHGYETELQAGCERFSQCRYDGGAFGRIVDKREYVSSDLNHFSIKGHAKAAAVAWEAMKRAGLVPRTRSAFSAPAGEARVTTSPGKNGRIAFKRYLDSGHSTGAIFTIGANGRGELQITEPKPGVKDDQPDWSPDGSLLLFHRCAPDAPCAIYTVKADGSDLTQLSPHWTADTRVSAQCEDGEGASFLPDGKRVVYTRSTGKERHFRNWNQIEHSDIVVRGVNGTNPRVLIRSRPFAGDYEAPLFSPGGSQFVYVRANSPLAKPALKHALFVVRADGSGQRRITPWSLDAGDSPDWSPHGKLIVFRSPASSFEGSQVYVVRPDGTGLRQLTRFKAGTTVLSYSFSPDGKWIAFSKSGRSGEPDVFVMRANGTQIRPVTRSALWDSAPDWGPR